MTGELAWAAALYLAADVSRAVDVHNVWKLHRRYGQREETAGDADERQLYSALRYMTYDAFLKSQPIGPFSLVAKWAGRPGKKGAAEGALMEWPAEWPFFRRDR